MPNGKKIHWTQRPENKARVKASLKKAHAAKQVNKKKRAQAKKQSPSSSTPAKASHVKVRERIQEGVFSYALGHVECWIATYAASADVSAEALAAELGAVLSRKVRR